MRERKRTLMVLHLLEAAQDADREALVEWLSDPGRGERGSGDGNSAVVLDLMARYRSLEVARAYGAALSAEAETAFEEAFGAIPSSEHTRFLLQMVPYMLGRQV